jgi:hypothetical protein
MDHGYLRFNPTFPRPRNNILSFTLQFYNFTFLFLSSIHFMLILTFVVIYVL